MDTDIINTGGLAVVEAVEATCCKCGHKWFPRVAAPRYCPACKRVDWNDGKPKQRKRHEPESSPKGQHDKS